MTESTADSDQVVKLLHTLEKMSHPGIAMALGARLEFVLTAILHSEMPNISGRIDELLFEGYGPLSSFAAKIDVAFALGFISEEERRYLHAIKKIRNTFAHSVSTEINFEHETIVKVCARLPNPRSGAKNGLEHFVQGYDNCEKMLQKRRDTQLTIAALLEHKKKNT